MHRYPLASKSPGVATAGHGQSRPWRLFIAAAQRWFRTVASGRESSCTSVRRGAVTVELAVTLPLLVTLTLGTIETCHLVQVRTQMMAAAYEAARLATRPTTATQKAATPADVVARCQSILNQFSVQGATITVTPSDFSNRTPQGLVTVNCAAPLNQNTVTAFFAPQSYTISTSVSLVFE